MGYQSNTVQSMKLKDVGFWTNDPGLITFDIKRKNQPEYIPSFTNGALMKLSNLESYHEENKTPRIGSDYAYYLAYTKWDIFYNKSGSKDMNVDFEVKKEASGMVLYIKRYDI